ncbi:hypothetical protein P0R31_09005 [Bradyrhizobium yuanmingense]|uniref:hypothetical protein n=1 Tax=Bradyrhizobium yuanmingense TaxID=108015 RepID=UPI0023B8DE99|nr:hypothetical protein [Bradyrhizobium yuanmingense]MDF0517369.1 hypothetical protein [Bradyrhizobium yuanmingense]
MALLDDETEQADDDAPVQRFRIPWTARDFRRMEFIAVAGEERHVCHAREIAGMDGEIKVHDPRGEEAQSAVSNHAGPAAAARPRSFETPQRGSSG